MGCRIVYIGIIFTSRPDGRPVSSFGCRQPVPAMGGLRVVRSECTRKSGAAHRCHHSGQSRQATKKQMRELVKKYKVGGLLFSEGTPEEQAILTNMARKDAKIPVMVTFDGEWGLSMRLKGVPDYPRNAALGCIETMA